MSKEATMYPEYVEKYFHKVVGQVTEKYNGQNRKPELFYKTMLTEEYSADLSWGSTELNSVILAADVVAMDASIPLKKRGSIAAASGKIAKIALKFRKGEKEISDLNIMISRGAQEETIAAKVLNDVPRCIGGIEYRNQMLFEEALSTGQMLVAQGEDNDGTGIRVTFVPAANEYKARVADWVERPDIATPQEDVQQIFDAADADQRSIAILMISKKYFDAWRKTRNGKELTANFQQREFTATTVLPTPSRSLFKQAVEDEYGVEVRIVDNEFKVQLPNGDEKRIRPWVEANVVGIPQANCGRLVYGTLAEETRPVNGVDYEKSGSFILVSKYSHNDPLEEFTAGQALCLPVLDGASGYYILHANEVAEGAISVDEGDDDLSFAKTQEKKVVTLSYLGDAANLSAEADEDFVTVSLKGNKLSITCAANSESSAPERTATVTVTDGQNSLEIAITQAANT